MSRQTQFIGLTSKAQQFISRLKKLEADQATEGMFGESYMLGKWEANGEYLEKGSLVREVVQTIPWSGGSMIFTCLEVECLNGQKIRFHQWVADPTMQTKQYDTQAGTMWV